MARVLARFAVGDLPKLALSALRSARVSGFYKPSGGVRVLGCGNAIRRMVLGQAIRMLNVAVRDHCGLFQFGLQPDGTGRLHRLLQSAIATRHDIVVISVDQKDAYSCVWRTPAISACFGVSKVLGAIAEAVLEDDCTHVINAEQGVETLLQKDGFDQGCNGSSAFYCVASTAPSAAARDELRDGDPAGFVAAFIDDTYFVGTPAAAERGMLLYQRRMKETYGVQENVLKRKVLVGPDVDRTTLSSLLAPYVVDSLKAVGTQLAFARADLHPVSFDASLLPAATGLTSNSSLPDALPHHHDAELPDEDDWRDLPVRSDGAHSDPTDFLDRQGQFFARIRELHTHGLKLAHCLTLLRVWSQGAYVHYMRALPCSTLWATAVDTQLVSTIDALCREQRFAEVGELHPYFLRLKESGLGMGCALSRIEAAYVGAWETGLEPVLAALKHQTAASFRTAWPRWAGTVDAMDQSLERKKGKPLSAERWERYASHATLEKRQRLHYLAVRASALRAYTASLSHEARLHVELCSGPEASAHLIEHEGYQPLGDAHLRASLGARFLRPFPAGGDGTCHHVGRNGRKCGISHGPDRGRHARICKKGGGVDARHDACRDAIWEWLCSLGKAADREQRVPKWDTREEEARLDVALLDPALGELFIDISLTDSVFPGASTRAIHGIARRERKKHKRYPGQGLVPFVLDVRGRWGKEAKNFVQAVVGTLPKESRVEALQHCRRLVAHALQSAVATQLLTAAAPWGAPV